VIRYECGHVGFVTEGKVKAFIRVAEIRNAKVEDSDKKCPEHGRI
jgi:hypothetical protein